MVLGMTDRGPSSSPEVLIGEKTDWIQERCMSTVLSTSTVPYILGRFSVSDFFAVCTAHTLTESFKKFAPFVDRHPVAVISHTSLLKQSFLERNRNSGIATCPFSSDGQTKPNNALKVTFLGQDWAFNAECFLFEKFPSMYPKRWRDGVFLPKWKLVQMNHKFKEVLNMKQGTHEGSSPRAVLQYGAVHHRDNWCFYYCWRPRPIKCTYCTVRLRSTS